MAFADSAVLEPSCHGECGDHEFAGWCRAVQPDVRDYEPPPFSLGLFDKAEHVRAASANAVDLRCDDPTSASIVNRLETVSETSAVSHRRPTPAGVLKPLDDREPLGLGCLGDRASLGIEADAARCLSGGAHSDVGNEVPWVAFRGFHNGRFYTSHNLCKTKNEKQGESRS